MDSKIYPDLWLIVYFYKFAADVLITYSTVALKDSNLI